MWVPVPSIPLLWSARAAMCMLINLLSSGKVATSGAVWAIASKFHVLVYAVLFVKLPLVKTVEAVIVWVIMCVHFPSDYFSGPYTASHWLGGTPIALST